jgi:hypothetical protein
MQMSPQESLSGEPPAGELAPTRSQPPSRVAEGYILVPADPVARDEIDLLDLLVAFWRQRWVFMATLLLVGIPMVALAVRGDPPITVSTVIAQATSGSGASSTSPITPGSMLVDRCKEVVFPELLAVPVLDGESDRRFAGWTVEVRSPSESHLLVMTVQAPTAQQRSAMQFVIAAREAILKFEAEREAQFTELLDLQIRQASELVAVLLASERSALPGSVEQAQIGIEINRQQSRLQGLELQRGMMQPARVVREVAVDQPESARSWLIRRSSLAVVGALVPALGIAAVSALIPAFRRRLAGES